MQHAVLDNIFWMTDLVGEIALLLVLIHKRRWKQFPAFTALIASPLVASLILFPLAHFNANSWYARVYWGFACINFLIQCAVILELARVVLRPTGTWVRDSRSQFITFSLAGVLVALAFAYLVAPPSRSLVDSLELRGDLFTSLVVCETVIAMSLASNRLGLGWRSHVMAIGQGLTAWAIVAVVTDSIHSYYGAARFFAPAQYLKFASDLGALGYWCVALWREEPERQPISGTLLKYIVALHQRVNYDLEEAGN